MEPNHQSQPNQSNVKVITWNINGLRSFGGVKEWRQLFANFNADLICFQETKIPRSSVEEWMTNVPDYTSYFTFPGSHLQTSGYSGVATFCRESNHARPVQSEISLLHNLCGEIFKIDKNDYKSYVMEIEKQFLERWKYRYKHDDALNVWKAVDSEGRCVLTKHTFITMDDLNDDKNNEIDNLKPMLKNLYLFNLYCPRSDNTRIDRIHYQLRFYHLIEQRALQLLNTVDDDNHQRNHVMIVGDLNTTYDSIDVYDDEEWHYAGSASRQWLQHFLSLSNNTNSCHTNHHSKYCFYDSFRILNPSTRNAFTCWNTMLGARATNYGSRLDYILIDHKLIPYLSRCYHLTDQMGSDHCPVVVEFDTRLRFSHIVNDVDRFSINCTKRWPEFGNGAAQTLIQKFFTTSTATVSSSINELPPSNSTLAKTTKTTKGRVPPKQMSIFNYVRTYTSKLEPINKVDAKQTSDSQNESQMISLSQNSESNNENQQSSELQSNVTLSSATQWAALLRPDPPPLCTGHKLPCVKRRSKKSGPRQGAEYYCCPKTAIGPTNHPDAKCNYFRWVNVMKKFTSPNKIISSPIKSAKKLSPKKKLKKNQNRQLGEKSTNKTSPHKDNESQKFTSNTIPSTTSIDDGDFDQDWDQYLANENDLSIDELEVCIASATTTTNTNAIS